MALQLPLDCISYQIVTRQTRRWVSLYVAAARCSDRISYQILTRQTRQWVSLRWTKWRLSKESFICKLFMERKQIVCRHVIRIQYCTAANVLYMKTSVSPPSSRGPWRTCSSGRSSAWSCTWAGCYSSFLHDFETRSFCTFSKFDFTGTETHLLSEVEI